MPRYLRWDRTPTGQLDGRHLTGGIIQIYTVTVLNFVKYPRFTSESRSEVKSQEASSKRTVIRQQIWPSVLQYSVLTSCVFGGPPLNIQDCRDTCTRSG